MKHLLKIFILISLFSIYGCNKVKRACTNEIVATPSDQLISDEQLIQAKALLNSASIDYSNYRIYRFEKSFTNYYHIRCHQFVNGLQVFTNDIIFHFDENKNYSYRSGDSITSIALNAKSSLNATELKEIYLNKVIEDPHYERKLRSITKNCINLQFGYYDLNASKGDTTIKMVKAWKINPLNSDAPKMYVNDENSEIISYHNGIIE